MEAPWAEADPAPGRRWNPWEIAPIHGVDTAGIGLLRVRVWRFRQPRIPGAGGCLTPPEHAAWQDKAAPAGVSPSALLRGAMARTRTWTAQAQAIERERTRQVVRIGNNLNQLARWANTHKTAAEAVTVIAHLVSFERSLLDVAKIDEDDGDAP